MAEFQIKRCRQMEALNMAAVEAEINFSRTVHFTREINLTAIEKIRAAAIDGRPSYTSFIAKAVAIALLEFPYANRRLFHPPFLPFLHFFQTFQGTDIAIAVERDVPGQAAVAYIEVIRDAGKLSLRELTEKLKDFSAADLESSRQWKTFYRLGTSLPHWLGGWIVGLPRYFPKMWKKYRGGAAMISSPAKYGVGGVTAAWPHPLGFSFGLVQKKPMVIGDEVKAVTCFTFAMNWDRRVMAGAQAARFFARICDLLNEPSDL